MSSARTDCHLHEAAPSETETPRKEALRPRVLGPFLWLSDEKFTVRAVTYGTFAANDEGDLFPPREQVRRDFAMIRENHANAIRTYTAPPDWLMDEARQAGLRVLCGIYWDGRDCRYDDPATYRDAEHAVREAVTRLSAHPDVVLAYCIGNEIPPLTARLHGRRTIERFLHRLYHVAKDADPEGLVTYGNYPTTEFLQLDFLDFLTLNVYLLEPGKLSAYLDRMMIESKGKPLLLGEVGDDSHSEGKSPELQARLLSWTIPMVFDKGACGVCVFSFTDDWVVGGERVLDWRFGLVTRDREPKPALEVVRERFSESPLSWREDPWPRVSVVVCNYNGGDTLDETLCSLERLEYPDYEIILVDDGSTDRSREIARPHAERVRIIEQENQGLSVARNVGAGEATGEIVAYIDSDAYADPDWLRHLVRAMDAGDYSGAGGPNLTPESDGLMAQFIAFCPGNPTHVLKDNRNAEHVAGVNMAFRRDALLSLGGFDPVHRRAGDDVDICWRFEDAGLRLAFAPAGIVWHHRRPSIRRYLRQQAGYGEAENQLERKHPERFNLAGSIRWAGRVYLAPRSASAIFKPFIYHGRFGTALFQSLYHKSPASLMEAPRLIHWYYLWIVLLLLTPLSLWFLPPAAILMGASAWVAFVAAWTTEFPRHLRSFEAAGKVAVIGFLHFLHPVVRHFGRVHARLSHVDAMRWALALRWLRPRRVLREIRHSLSHRKELQRFWGIGGGRREEFLLLLQTRLKKVPIAAHVGQDFDNHDLEINCTVANVGRLYTAPEHYDQALCLGFRARMTSLAQVAIAGSAVLALALAVFVDVRFAALLALPLIGLYYVLALRARLRTRLWGATRAVMRKLGAKRFETEG